MDMSGEEIHKEEPVRYPPVHVDLIFHPTLAALLLPLFKVLIMRRCCLADW